MTTLLCLIVTAGVLVIVHAVKGAAKLADERRAETAKRIDAEFAAAKR